MWSGTVFPANRRMKLGLFTNYGLICTELAQENHLSKPKNEIIEGNCNLSACDSVYREIFVSRRETGRLN